MKSQLVLGIMSGTSIDSVDYALCSVSETQIRLETHWQVKFPPRLQERLHCAARNGSSSYELAQLHHDLGRFYARGAMRGPDRRMPRLVGLHGQTLFHNPSPKTPATFQAGEPAYLVEALRVPVINNFRVADLAAGGQGAPLATFFHQFVFSQKGKHVCVNNLGGISNVTSIDWSAGGAPAILAFDTGPANMLMDLAVRYFTRGQRQMDKSGAWAARGTACERLLSEWLQLDYFRREPPKSTGREMFGEPFFKRIAPQMRKAALSRFDQLATLTEFTARSLSLNYRLHLHSVPERVVLAGGGAANPTLVKAIRAQLRHLNPGSEVLPSTDLGWPVQSIEPAAFALLAFLRMQGKAGNVPGTTGARRAALLGQISEP